MAQAFLPVFGRSPKDSVRAHTPDTGRNAGASVIVAILMSATIAIAQTMPATTQATTRPRGDFRTLTVSPMAVPVPALKYPLRVAFADQIDGNAAQLYLQAFAEIALDATLTKVTDAMYDLDENDHEAFAKWVADNTPGFDTSVPPLIATATLRGECDWSLPIRYENIRTLLPFLNRGRQAANVLRAKFRLALHRNDITQAIRLLRACSTLADRVDDGETLLINNLVSVGIQAMCLEMQTSLIRRVDAPNLYWSLRQYPVPFGDLRGSLEGEREMVLAAYPTLRKARDGGPIVADDWQRYTAEQAAFQRAFSTPPSTTPAEYESQFDLASGLTAMAMNGLAKAHYARTRHVDDTQVSKLDPRMLAAVYTIETYQQMSDSVYACHPLPYPEMLPALRRAQAAIARQPLLAQTNPFAIAAPSLTRAAITNARLDRTIAAITVVEALRAYAAAYDNTLPPTLDAIVDTPAPMNPVTGKPFDYSVTGDVATIGDAGTLVDWPLRYEVRLRK